MIFKEDWDLENGFKNSQEPGKIQIDYWLNNLKPLHAKCFMYFYNLMSTMEGKNYN